MTGKTISTSGHLSGEIREYCLSTSASMQVLNPYHLALFRLLPGLLLSPTPLADAMALPGPAPGDEFPPSAPSPSPPPLAPLLRADRGGALPLADVFALPVPLLADSGAFPLADDILLELTLDLPLALPLAFPLADAAAAALRLA